MAPQLSDQANGLRQMARHTVRDAGIATASAMRWVMVVGGKGGVGTTTVAIRLSGALVAQGARTVLVDADLDAPDIAPYLGLDPECSLGDCLAGETTLHAALLPASAGLQVVCGRWNDALASHRFAHADRLVPQLATLGPHADVLVVDCGSRADHAVEQQWRVADDVVLVTLPDDVAVMDTYAKIKRHWPATGGRLWLVVNRAADARAAAAVHQRLATVCRRFLGARLGYLAGLPAGSHTIDPLPDAAATLLLDAEGEVAPVYQNNSTKQQEGFNPRHPASR